MPERSVWIVSPAVHLEGGTERSVVEQARRWSESFEVSIYTMETRGVDLGACRVRRIWRPPGPHLARFLWWIAAQRLVRAWDALRLGAPDIVHSPGVNAFDARAIGVHMVFAKYRKRVLEPARERGIAGSGLRRLHRSAWVRLVEALEDRVYSGPATLWAFSADDATFLETRFRRPAGSVPVIPHGVDAERFAPAARAAARNGARARLVPGDGPVLLLVGNDGCKKGLDTAIRALALLPRDFRLAVVGDDDFAPFRNLARGLRLESRIQFRPGGTDILDWYAAADVLVAPSRDDAFHLPALEAMASGLPVVLSARAGVAELVRNDEEALIIEDAEDENALALGIERVAREAATSARMAAAGRALAETLTWDLAATRIAALLEREIGTPRVLVLAPDAFGFGGIEQMTRTLLGALCERYGADRVGLLSLRGPGDHATDVTARIVSLPEVGRPPTRVPRSAKLRFAAASLQAARRWRGRQLVIVATHAHLAPVARACAAASGAPYAVWAHGQEVWGRLPAPVRWAMAGAHAIFAPSAFTAGAAARSIPSLRARIEVIPHGVSAFEPVVDARRDADLVLSVARLDAADRYKGVDTLVLAWPAVLRSAPGARLEVVGDGTDRPRLERLAAQLGIGESVRFRGALPAVDRNRAFASASVFALPGRHIAAPEPRGEGFGLVFLEAAAAGLPCVAGAAAGATEAVEDAVTGLLTDPLDPAAVSKAVIRLLLDPDLARKMGEAGRRRALLEFGLPRFAASIGHLFDRLAATGARS